MFLGDSIRLMCCWQAYHRGDAIFLHVSHQEMGLLAEPLLEMLTTSHSFSKHTVSHGILLAVLTRF